MEQGGRAAVGAIAVPLPPSAQEELATLTAGQETRLVPSPENEHHFQVLITDAARDLVAEFGLLLDPEFPVSAPQIRLPAGRLVRPWVDTVTGVVDVPGMQEKPWVASQT